LQGRDAVKAARIEATKALTRPLATLSLRERDRVRAIFEEPEYEPTQSALNYGVFSL
jgi:hypothetical protein